MATEVVEKTLDGGRRVAAGKIFINTMSDVSENAAGGAAIELRIYIVHVEKIGTMVEKIVGFDKGCVGGDINDVACVDFVDEPSEGFVQLRREVELGWSEISLSEGL